MKLVTKSLPSAVLSGALMLPLCLAASRVQAQPAIPDVAVPEVAAPDAKAQDSTLTVQALSPLVGGPTTVTLQGQDISLQTAVEALLKTVNRSAERAIVSNAKRPVTVNWDKTPFWQAAQDLEVQTGLSWVTLGVDNPNGFLQLVEKRDYFSFLQNSLVGLSGVNTPLVKVVATQVLRTKQSALTLGDLAPDFGAPPSDASTLQLCAYFDPHIRLAANSIKVRLVTPPPPKNDTIDPNNLGSSPAVGMSAFEIKLASQVGQTKVPLVQGVVQADVILKSALWEVPDITVAKTATRIGNGTTYSLEDVRLEGDAMILRLSLSKPGSTSAREAFTGGLGSTPPRVFDGEGKEILSRRESRIDNASIQNMSVSRREFRYPLRVSSKDFPEGEVRPGPFKLVWDIPTETKTLQVPFEFRDVPLP